MRGAPAGDNARRCAHRSGNDIKMADELEKGRVIVLAKLNACLCFFICEDFMISFLFINALNIFFFFSQRVEVFIRVFLSLISESP